jgi:hypothetical protein
MIDDLDDGSQLAVRRATCDENDSSDFNKSP